MWAKNTMWCTTGGKQRDSVEHSAQYVRYWNKYPDYILITNFDALIIIYS